MEIQMDTIMALASVVLPILLGAGGYKMKKMNDDNKVTKSALLETEKDRDTILSAAKNYERVLKVIKETMADGKIDTEEMKRIIKLTLAMSGCEESNIEKLFKQKEVNKVGK